MRIEAHLPAVAPWLRKIAANAAPREACGVLTRSQQVVELANRSPTPETCFDAGPLHEIEEREGELLAIWHTHPDNEPPSSRDVAACQASFLPWVIAGPACVFVLHPEPQPLISRDFIYGSQDCLSIITDRCAARGIWLPWFERPPFGWWRSVGPSPYVEHVEACGFVAIPFAECGTEHLQVDDILLLQYKAKRVNHAAIYIGGGYILHHLCGELSRAELFSETWQRATRFVCRPRPRC
jgi:proteasome lid subunit RPN8/RPN11